MIFTNFCYANKRNNLYFCYANFVVRKCTVSFVKTSIEKFRAETAGNLKKKIIILTNLSTSYFLSDEICCKAEHFEQLFPMRITDGRPRFSSYVRAEIFRCFSFQAGLD